MKIAIITDNTPDQVNGVVSTINNTITMLRTKHHAQVFLVHADLFRNFSIPTYREIKVCPFAYSKMKKLLDEYNPGYIHITTEGMLGVYARMYCKKKGLKYTTSYHTDFSQYLKKMFWIPKCFTTAILRKFHERADAILVTTKTMKDKLREDGFMNNIVIWSRGVNHEQFHPQVKSEIVKTDKKKLIYVGRISIEKGIKDFLELEGDYQKIVVGDGPLRKDFEAEYPEVIFTGYLKGEELCSAYAEADVFVFPSKTDTFGLVMIEAMACGTPVAGYEVQGPVDVIDNGISGCYHPDLGFAVQVALQCDPKDCVEYARKFSWENCTKTFLSTIVENE